MNRAILNTFSIVSTLIISATSLCAQTLYFGNEKWEINDPFAAKGATLDPKKANVKGTQIVKLEVINGATAEVSKRISDATRIEWGTRPKLMDDAEIEVQRGEGAKALSSIETIVQFFTPVKKVPGSLWLRAASIKLDALVLLKNDAVIEKFISELEEMNDGSIPGLENKIALAKLEQTIRKGKSEVALAEADKLIRTNTNLDLLANLHIIKGTALLDTAKYEDAMSTFLRVPVFYGSQSKYMPAALLGAAKSFRGMNTPSNRELQLEDVANQYLTEIIRNYPLSKEAEQAKQMLPKDIREALAKEASDTDAIATAVITEKAENE